MDDAYSGARPVVAMQYINNTGLEGAWTYQSQDIGRAGTGYVNNYNGNVIFTHTADSLIKLIYNSNDKSKVNEVTGAYGPGWKLNLNQKIIESSKIASDDGSYTKRFIDANGEEFKNIYSPSKGNLDVTINSKGTATYNSYDEMDNLVKTSAYSQYENAKKAETFLINGNTNGDCGGLSEADLENYTGTMICASKVRWRVADEYIGQKEIYIAK